MLPSISFETGRSPRSVSRKIRLPVRLIWVGLQRHRQLFFDREKSCPPKALPAGFSWEKGDPAGFSWCS